MATQRLAPDAVLASANLGASPSVAAIQDDPDSPDGSWLEAVADDAATDLRVSFPSPAGNLVAGAGLQEFRALLRKSAASAGTPTVDVQLYEAGSLKGTLLSGAAIASDTGQVVSATWNASLLADASGVECRIVATPASGGSTMPSVRSTGAGASMTGTGTLSIPFPGTVGAGDLLLIHFCCRGGTTRQHTVPTGWTELFSNVRASIRQAILVRNARATAGESGSQDVAWTGSGSNLGAVGRMYAIADTSGQVEGGNPAEGGNASIEIPSITTIGADRLALAFSSCITSQNTGDATGETGGDYAQIAAEYATSLITIDGQSAAMASAGTISGGVIALGASRDWATRSFAFLPASGTPASVDIGAVEWNAEYQQSAASGSASAGLVSQATALGIKAAAGAGAAAPAAAAQSSGAKAAQGATTAAAAATASAPGIKATGGGGSAAAAASLGTTGRKAVASSAATSLFASASASAQALDLRSGIATAEAVADLAASGVKHAAAGFTAAASASAFGVALRSAAGTAAGTALSAGAVQGAMRALAVVHGRALGETAGIGIKQGLGPTGAETSASPFMATGSVEQRSGAVAVEGTTSPSSAGRKLAFGNLLGVEGNAPAASGRKATSGAAAGAAWHAATSASVSVELRSGSAAAGAMSDALAQGMREAVAPIAADLATAAATAAFTARLGATAGAAFGSVEASSLRFLRKVVLQGSWHGPIAMSASSSDGRRLMGST